MNLMRIFGQPEAFGRLREDDEDAPALVLTEATLVAAPGDLRAIARFLAYAADQLETWGRRSAMSTSGIGSMSWPDSSTPTASSSSGPAVSQGEMSSPRAPG